MDPNTATAWRDLFVGMVAAGASLAGLTFVAVALDPHSIERTLAAPAASALGNFAAVMFIGVADCHTQAVSLREPAVTAG